MKKEKWVIKVLVPTCNKSLCSPNDDEKDENADTVKLMTIHSAKDLEFGCVFACGLEEMLFPNAMSINTRRGIGGKNADYFM